MQVAQQLDWLTEEAVRSKLLPLLMQWDLCHPHEVRHSPLLPLQARHRCTLQCSKYQQMADIFVLMQDLQDWPQQPVAMHDPGTQLETWNTYLQVFNLNSSKSCPASWHL